MVLMGSPESPLEGISLQAVSLAMQDTTEYPGGYLDLRPSQEGLVELGQMPAILVDWAHGVQLDGVEVRCWRSSTPVYLSGSLGCCRWLGAPHQGQSGATIMSGWSRILCC